MSFAEQVNRRDRGESSPRKFLHPTVELPNGKRLSILAVRNSAGLADGPADECLYTVGAQSRGGYAFADRRGRRRARSALSFDLEGPGPPQLNLLAFPGEEPPQIECNEDAGGAEADE